MAKAFENHAIGNGMHEATGQSAHARKCLERVAGNCQCNGRHFFDPATGQAQERFDLDLFDGNIVNFAQSLHQASGEQTLDDDI